MVIVSELAAHGPLDSFAETMPGITEERFCAMAKKHNIWLIPGSFFELRNNAVFNTAPVINPQGEVIARHRKLFPFCPFEEGITAGDEFVVFDVPGAGRFGLCICYDMWFPEVLRTLTSMGAEVILHPVLTGTNDRDIELNLARSSGALFQSYIIDINGLGVGGIGQSCIIDPAGRVVYQAGETDEFLVTELDFDSVRRQREVGLRNLGQPLKSFRDSKINFTVYNKEQREDSYLDSLGPLQKATRQSKAIKATEPAFIASSELSIAPAIAEYNNLVIDSTVAIPLIATEQQVPLEFNHVSPGFSEEPVSNESLHPSITEKSTIINSSITPVDENEEQEIEVKLEVPITPLDNKEKSKGENLKWLKDASTQIKQYIKP